MSTLFCHSTKYFKEQVHKEAKVRPNRFGSSLPAQVVHLDVNLTGDQEVVGLTPAGLATFFC